MSEFTSVFSLDSMDGVGKVCCTGLEHEISICANLLTLIKKTFFVFCSRKQLEFAFICLSIKVARPGRQG